MASLSAINQYSNAGFYKTPVSKSLMVFVGCSHAASHVPAFGPTFRKIFTGTLNLASTGNVIRFIASKLIFPDTRSTILALFLIYFFRVFERRSGSLRFSSNILFSWTLGMSMEILGNLVLPDNWSPLLSTGPLHLFLPFFIPYYLHVPITASTYFGPIPISSKSMPYLLGLQISLNNPSTIVSSLSSMLVGCIVHCTSLGKASLPRSFGKISKYLSGWLLESSPPPPPSTSNLMGATLEIQRTQHAEAMEQQLLRARARQFNVPIGGRQMRLDEMWGQGGGNRRVAAAPGGADPAPILPSPQLLQALTDMGFPRERVEQALIRANNDMEQATNFLLQDI